MADTTNEWELSKENILPIQQGRKQKALKIALAPQTEDLVLQERNAFEHELRTYSGVDPLSVWCKYIKWVEQNYPKGGREGHIKQLIERCLSILRGEKKYYDDDRFIDIMLKFANINVKPLEVYTYMYSHNIGCKSAKFFISWSWELEQLGSLKKADEVLTEGVQRQAEPYEKIQAYRKEFDTRLAVKIKEKSENTNFVLDSGRSAFAMLKPQKKNLAPISRVGEAVIDKRNPLVLNRQQPQPKMLSVSSKTPFKIYNSENVAPLPVQSHSTMSHLNSENYKENEQKPSKWNKVKVKPRVQSMRVLESNPGFKFHCDEENEQQVSTPRSVPKTSNILKTRCRTPSPVMALFEPPDPLKRAMYPKDKVYGGAEEYSLEEIRAATWLERKRKNDQELMVEEKNKVIEEQNKIIETLALQVQLLQNANPKLTDLPCVPNLSSLNEENEISKSSEPYNVCQKRHPQAMKMKLKIPPLADIASYLVSAKDESENHHSTQNNFLKSNTNSMTDDIENKRQDSTSYREADKMVQELYNRSLFHNANIADLKANSDCSLSHVASSSKRCLPDSYVANSEEQKSDVKETENDLPFVIYHDLTEVIPNSNSFKQPLCSAVPKVTTPFTLYHDPTEDLSKLNVQKPTGYTRESAKMVEPRKQMLESKNDKGEFPLNFYYDEAREIFHSDSAVARVPKENYTLPLKEPPALENENNFDEDSENVPPKEYIQIKKQRVLTGILEPSKNIYFIPLEEQEAEELDDSDGEDAFVCQPRREYPDETLIPPSNTEQFSTDMFLASTPYSKKNDKVPLIDKSKESAGLVSSNISSNTCNIKEKNVLLKENSNQISVPNFVDTVVKEHVSSMPPALPKVLSVIMETSSENYSKSSSSSSSSVNLTKSGHLDPHSSQFNSVRKPYLKLEPIERCSLSSVSEVPDTVFQINSYKQDEISGVSITPKGTEEIKLYSVHFDPFDSEETAKHLKTIHFQKYTNFTKSFRVIRTVKNGENISIGKDNYRIECLIAEGAYAKVYKALKLTNTTGDYSGIKSYIALKVCKNGNEWEFYVCNEIQNRLTVLNYLPDIKDSILNIHSAIKYTDGIVLANEHSTMGTLLDVINFYKKKHSTMPDVIVMYLTYEILHIVSQLHKIKIIHGDIKPDNFLLKPNAFQTDVIKNLSKATSSLRLIDFGRAIDLTKYENGVCFTKTLSESHFKCTEMKEGKPWVFQIDWYGVLSCIHTMLFSEYMAVKKVGGKWGIEKKFKRYWYTALWEPLFSDLLNIPGCYQEPNLKLYIDMIGTRLMQNTNFAFELTRLEKSYSATRKMF